MHRTRPLAATVAAIAMALVAASTALAKGEDALATLDAPLPVDAQPGTEISIGWTLTIAQDDGSTLPFSAQGVFIRLATGSSEPMDIVARQDRTGHYVATVTVPSGGLGISRIGLHGTACSANGPCERVDEFFRLAGVTAGPAAVAKPPSVDGAAGPDAAPGLPAAAPGLPAAPDGSALLPIVLVTLATVLVVGTAVVLTRTRITGPRSNRT